MRAGEADRARADLVRFGEQLAQLGYARRYRMDYLRGLARLAEGEGALDRALGHLHEAAGLAAELGIQSARGPIWREMVRLQTALGQEAAAQENQLKAARLQQVLAERIDDPQQRAEFLSRAW